MHLDIAAVRTNKAERDRKPQAASTLLTRDAVIDLLELVKNARLIGQRDPGTRILDRNLKMIADGVDADLYVAGVGEFDSIAHEVEHHLGQPPLVSIADRKIRWNDGSDLDALGMGQRAGRGYDCFHD